jgi:hypothetical protein
MRDIDPILADGLANQKGSAIIRVNTWDDISDWFANQDDPDHVWICTSFKIGNTDASCTIITANDYTISDFTVFTIERGLNIGGTEYTVESGLMFVRKYKENYGRITLEGSSYPNKKISIEQIDGPYETYQEVIEAFCARIGKTAVFKNEDDAWLGYQFFPSGKNVSLNKPEFFESLLKQKYTILVYEESPGNLVFYNQDSYLYFPTATAPRGIAWSPELGLFATIFALTDTIATSADGIYWKLRDAAENNHYQDICWSPELGLFCTVSITGTFRVSTSPDGITWTGRTASSVHQWDGICWSPELGLFCAVAYGAGFMTSPDGITWTARTAPSASLWIKVTWSPELGLFCAVTETGDFATSPDGITWTARTGDAEDKTDICWSPELGLFCAVGATILTSPDGITWTARTNPEANSLQSIAWSPELGLFAAVASNGTNRVLTSPNGITWTGRSAAEANAWRSIEWSPELGLFCALSDDGTNRVQTSADGITWNALNSTIDHNLTYQDGPASHIVRDQSEIHYLWRDEAATIHTAGDTDRPQWNLGYLESTDSPPATRQDPYYKIFLQKAPVRLDITDSDRIHFEPYWSIDPTQTIDAMMQVTEVFDTKKSPSWYQEIRSIILFNATEGGALPSTIERVAAYTPLVTTNFDGNLDETVNNLQAFAEAVDELELGTVSPPIDAPTATNDFLIGAQVSTVWTWVKNTLAQAVTVLRTSLDSIYAAIVHTHKYTLTFGSHAQGGTVGARPGGVGTFTRASLSIFNVGFAASLAANPINYTGTLKNLRVRGTSGAQPASGDLIITINVAGSATALTLTIPAGSTGTTFENTSNSVAYTAGDLVRIDCDNYASAASKPLGLVTFDIEVDTS